MREPGFRQASSPAPRSARSAHASPSHPSRSHPSPSGWQLGASGPAAYERYLVPRFFRAWAERLVRLAEIASGDRVLDVGCGTGIVARTAAAAGAARTVGLDPNEGMLEEARRSDGGDAVEWRAGSAEALPFEEGAFDRVLSQQALQFVGDRRKALAEMRRVLAPGGRVALAVLRDTAFNPSYEALAAALDRHAGRSVGDMMRSPFQGPGAAELRAELEAAGLREVSVRHDLLAVRYPSPEELLRQEAAAAPLAGPVSELPDERVEALLADLRETLAPYTDDEGVVFPMETLLVRAGR